MTTSSKGKGRSSVSWPASGNPALPTQCSVRPLHRAPRKTSAHARGKPRRPRCPTLNFPWAQDGLTDIEREALGYLQVIQRNHRSLAEEVLRTPWLGDDIVEGERTLLCILASVRESSAATAMFRAITPSGAEQYFGPCPREATTTPVSDPANFPWAQDGLTDIEREALGYLQVIQRNHRSLAEEVLREPWLGDDIVEGERTLLCLLASVRESSTADAVFRATTPSGAAQDFGPCPQN